MLTDVHALTDPCVALGMARAARRGVETELVVDKVNAGSPYSMHQTACERGVPTLVTEWNQGSAQARNHHKLVVVDDVVVTGSMNLSEAGVSRNHENTLMITVAALADQAAGLVHREAALPSSLGVLDACR